MKRLYALILLLFSLILPFDGQDGSFSVPRAMTLFWQV